MSAPLIAIPAYRLPPGRVSRWTDGAFAVPDPYVDALRRAGARPVLLTAPDEGPAEEILAPFDGLMLIGGGDVDSFLYDTEPHDRAYGLNRERDDLEISLVRAADEAKVPTLAICRGIQLANVAFGGTLHQHLPDLGITEHGVPQEDDGYSPHEVRIEPGSRLAAACGADRVTGLSSHHQAIDRLADPLRPVAWTDDGLVEGAEIKEHPWFVAVQWHPEVTAERDSAQQALFDAFAEHAAAESPA